MQYRSLRYCWYSLRQSGCCGVAMNCVWSERGSERGRKGGREGEREGGRGGREGGRKEVREEEWEGWRESVD